MIRKRNGSSLLEWVIGVVIVISVVGTAVYSVFNSLGNKFWEMNSAIK
jgi:hypothetical protein